MIEAQAVRDEFMELVRVDSVSLHEGEVAAVVQGKLEAMGLTVVRDQACRAHGGQTGNLIAKVPATAPGLPTLMFNAHLDTVQPGCGIEPRCTDGDLITSAGDTVLGADDKAGVTIILAALREILSQGMAHGELQIVFTVAEEIGLLGAYELDYSLIDPDFAFVFDSSRPPGGLVLGAPSAAKLQWRVHGAAAHAGNSPETGINAIQIAAQAIAAMRLGRLDDETTANIGVIKGGLARNIVPEECEISGEARSHDDTKLAAQVAHMKECFQQAVQRHEGARLEDELYSSYQSFRLAESDEVVQIAARAGERAGLTVYYAIGGGGSDGNVFNARGIPTVICATGGSQVHTLQEQVRVSSIVEGARWMVEMVRAD
jgi:tripeptide aminopeptidase